MNKRAALPEGGRGEFLDKRHNGVTLHVRELFGYLRLLFEAWCRCWFKEDATEVVQRLYEDQRSQQFTVVGDER